MISARIEALGGSLGACASGIDARRPLDPDDVEAIRAALAEHQVVFLRGQDLSAEEHIAFAVLNARVIPERGGDTIWVDLFAAYDALPDETKDVVQRCKLRHRPKPHFFETVRRHHGDEITNRLIAENPPVEHPLVRSHPVSGRPALFLSPLYEDSIVGVPADESDALLASLDGQLDNPEFHVRWTWQEHDLVIWDEASTNHRALGDHYPSHRRMQRCAVEGTRPFFRDAS